MSQTTETPATGTNETEVNNTQRLIAFKNAYITAASAIDKLKEPLEQLIEIKDFLYAVEKEGLMSEPDWAKFVNEDVGPGMSKRLAKERSYQENYLTAVANLMEALIVVFLGELRAKRYNEAFIAGMTFLFQPDCIIHKSHYQIPQDVLKKLRTANQSWRTELKVGDKIDVLVKADEKGGISGFLQAHIKRIEQDTLFVEYPESSNFYDGQIDRWATEICPFEQKTKEDYAWRKEFLENAIDFEVDAHDKSTWLKSTIFEIKKQTLHDRVIMLANVGFRVYRKNISNIRKDDRGTYEGWSSKFDEFIPIYSPRIHPWQSRVGAGSIEEDDDDEDLDDLVEPEPGMARVFAVPRIFKCISGQFLHYMNMFGNAQGFEMVIDVLENAKLSENGDLTISVMGCLAQIVTLPSSVLHKDFIKEYGVRIQNAIRARLLSASDKSLRDVRKDQLDSIYKSLDNVSRRFQSKDERDKQLDLLKLEMVHKCLNSEFLERRINAIKDLNQIIKNNTVMSSNKAFSIEFLIEWMNKQDVFSTIWDTRKTHIQLVQRSNDIFKLMCKEDLMTDELLMLFWTLTNTPSYKPEVFKILNETAFHLKTNHIEFFFNKITATPADKLSMEEFNALSELGKYCKNTDFMQKVTDFFWKIITQATHHTDELIENCIKKFTEMVQYWTVEQKWPLLEALTDQLKITENPALPVIRLFKKMIKDQKERVSYTSSATTSTYTSSYVSTYPLKAESGAPQESIYDCGADSTQTTVATTTPTEEGTHEEQINTEQSVQASVNTEKELTFDEVVNNLQKTKDLVAILLTNLESYCNRVASKLSAEPALVKIDRNKLFVHTKSASHADEVSERLQFLNYYASVSDFVISRVQLKVIYDLLAKSPIKSDLTEFLIWCKQACENSTNSKSILNLEEVGEFYSELIASKQLDVETLPMVGFDFLQHYFISVNENQSKLLKVKKEKVKATTNYTSGKTWQSYYLGKNTTEEVSKQEDKDPSFKIVINPNQLEKTELIWTIVLNSQNEEVIPKAVNFLIKTYLCLDECLADEAAQIQQELIEKCMGLIKSEKNPQIVKRVLNILKNIVKESEKRGTGGVQPHNAILKGELLDRIIIKNHTMQKSQNLIVSVYSSATVWEFVSEVSKMLWLTPKHVEFQLPNNRKIDETMHGMVLSQLNFKQGDVITARKISIEEEIPTGEFVDPKTRQFTPPAAAIFEEWWEVYKEEGTEYFTPNSATRFIKGCTHEEIGPDDSRIVGLFGMYDKEKTGRMSHAQFMDFFLKACTDRLERVLENLKCHHIRNDMQKIYNVKEESEFSKEQMPRYTMSANQSHFDLLMEVLEKNKDAQDDAWSLIRMLATNQEMYREVLTLKNAKDENGMINWQKFFVNSSVYKQIYNLEIIEAVMKEGEKQQDSDNNSSDARVFFVEYQDTGSKKNKAGWLPPQLKDKAEAKKEQSAEAEQKALYEQMKNNWTKQFVEHNGISFVLTRLLNQEFGKESNAADRNFELKNVSFMLTLLRVFIVASIAAQPDQDTSGAQQLLRRKSSIREHGEDAQHEEHPTDEAHAQLIHLLEETAGLELLLSIDFHALQNQLVKMMATICVLDTASIEEKQIVENALSLWVGILCYKPELFEDFKKFEGTGKIKHADELVMHGVLYSKEEKIREDFKTAFSVISKNPRLNGVLSFLIKVLSVNFKSISDFPCVQFFDLYNTLIDHYYSFQQFNQISDKEQSIFDPESVLSFIIDKIRAEKTETSETTNAEEEDVFAKERAEQNEKFRIGLIQLLGKIVTKVDAHLSEKIVQEKGLIQEIFKEFLFSSVYASSGNQSGHAKLSEKKTKKAAASTSNTKSREAAYQLLLSLIKKSPLLMGSFMKDQLMPLLEMIKKPNKWNYQPPGQSAALQKYVGLRNLGCICYMNSMLQQFFMTPAFRYNLLCIDDGTPEDEKEYKGEVFDDNLLHQLQRMMAHLELSERQDYNPKGFCFSFKEFDGAPTNTAEQKDAQEFLNVLFDRLDEALKPTPRKYLLQSIFGGKQINQMVCQECGKVKNRIEDYYNLSLTVKDIKSVHESLKKQVEGEIINDYNCEQCNRKVNLSKRTLIAECPNILIVHLARLVFNFETFRNDKINSMVKFPPVLDLKPYSYYEVMGQEGRLPKKTTEKADSDEETTEAVVDEDNIQPIQDDCFEYKLVGVNVHSGSANAGHYWSYINTNRSTDEGENDPNWIKTEEDPWMEFNDSRVSDFTYSKLEEECFGEEQTTSQSSAWSFGGGAYGKSGYMLFYERRKKKPLKILVPETQVEDVKAKGVNVHQDEKTKEFYKFVGYREGAENEKPSDIYQKVFEDNSSVTFENDIYSQEFFDFIKQILEKVASYADQSDATHELNNTSINVAKKVVIDILSRCFNNGGMKVMVQIMIEIFKKDDQLCKQFIASLLAENNSECILEILFDCTDKVAQANVSRLIRYLLCRLKVLEKEDLLNGTTESITEKVIEDGKEVVKEISLPKAVSAKFINVLLFHLQGRGAKSWARFEYYLDVIKTFGLNSAEEVENELQEPTASDGFDPNSEACKIGMHFYHSQNILERILDFILGDSSPIKQPGEKRVQMGSSFVSPNFTSLIKLVTVMMTDQELLAKFPMSEASKQMIGSKEMLSKMMEPSVGAADSTKEVIMMCKENFNLSKKVAKLLIKGINMYQVDKVTKYLKLLKKYLSIDDGFKLQRLEWCLGVPQIISKKQFRKSTYQYGLELVDKINDEANNFNTSLTTGTNEEALLTQLLKIRKQQETVCMIALKFLLKLCVNDDLIARYVYKCGPTSYQTARYVDWFRGYFTAHRSDLEKATSSGASSYSAYYENRFAVLTKAETLLEKFEEICKKFAEEEKAQLDAIKETDFIGLRETWMAYDHPEVITHFPPQLIIGKQVGENERVLMTEENESVIVKLVEIETEWMYSNPTGIFNLSIPDRALRLPNYSVATYEQYKNSLKKQEAPQEQGEPDVEQPEGKVEEEPEPLVVKDWIKDHHSGFVVLKVMCQSKLSSMFAISVKLEAQNNANKNVKLPISCFRDNLFSGDEKAIGHLVKIDPSKENWADFRLNITIKKKFTSSTQIQTSTNYSGGYSSNPYGVTTSYSNVGTSSQTVSEVYYSPAAEAVTAYVPTGGMITDDVKIACKHCGNLCDFGQDFCEKCGESQREDNADYFEP